LLLVIPLSNHLLEGDSLITLHPEKIPFQCSCNCFGQFSLPGSRWSFNQDRFSQFEGEEKDGDYVIVRDVICQGKSIFNVFSGNVVFVSRFNGDNLPINW
jgi:hypothetical protein